MEEILSSRDDSLQKIKNGGENLNRNIQILEIKLKNSEERTEKIREESKEEFNFLLEQKNKFLKEIIQSIQ